MITDGEENGGGEAATEVANGGMPAIEQPPVDNSRLLSLYETGMNEAKARADRLERELAEARRPAPVPEKPIDNQEFWNNGPKSIQEIVNKALDERIKPLTDFVAETRGQTKYDQIKERIREQPGIKDKFADVEPYLDQIMRTTEVTEQNVNTAVLSIIGAMATGQIAPATPRNVPAKKPGETIPAATTASAGAPNMPAHLRPSGPTVTPPANAKKERRQLTELEERIRREQRMTVDEYLDELEDTGPMQITDIMPKKKTPPTEKK